MSRHATRPINPRFYAVLDSVTTVSEASTRWYLGKTTVLNAIENDRVAAVKSGGTWLISVPSMVSCFGAPLDAQSRGD